jgi:serine/threonine-protein kinase
MTASRRPPFGAGADGPSPTTDRRALIEDIFEEALDVSAERRATWLESRCRDDDGLRQEVERLLAAHEQTEGPLDVPASARLATLVPDPMRGRRIGPYRVLRELGRGGMGVVYLAERDDGQFRRRVAVKVLRASQDADELYQRFVAERQILASLNHPHIAQLLDGGVADGELPYLVIEYVDGLPITEYCDRHRLDIPARLRLFREVCAAVCHAHQNLILHRDLKPGNVLVTGDGHVKLLDFGIAKLLNPSLSGVEQPVTRTAFRLMTPAYASPEQVRGDTLTTRSDVYALGLLLYELVAGRPAHRITTDSPREVYEVVCERDPQRPSDSVTNGAVDADAPRTSELAAARGTTPERLRRQLRGDLDAIVAMALRKEPGRRHATPELLAADVGRYLDGLPVMAHRGSGWYRFEKFVRRHRTAVTFAVASVLLLIVAAGVALRLAAVATRERDRAAAALTQTTRALQESEAVTGFLVGLFEASDPAEGGQDGLTAADLLRRGVTRAERLDAEPAAQARMLEALGQVYASRGDLELGANLLQRALVVRRRSAGVDDPRTAATAADLADVLRRQGKYASADTLAREALRVRRAADGVVNPDLAASLQQVSGIAVYLGDLAGAEAAQREAVAVARQSGGADSATVAALERLSAILWRRGDNAGAERALREALTVAIQAFPGRHAERSGVMLRLADLLDQRPEGYAEAESLARAALRDNRAEFGDSHPQTAAAMKLLGSMLGERGRTADGARMLRQAVAIEQRVWGPSHAVPASTMTELAQVLMRDGYSSEAEQLLTSSAAILATSLGTKHSAYAGTLGHLADVIALRGALDSAETLYRRAIDIRMAVHGSDQTITALTWAGLADVLTRRRRFAEADSLYRAALAVIRRHTTDTHVDARRAFSGLASMYDAWGKPDSAAAYRRLATR